MGYPALTSFLKPQIPRDDIPAEEKTPQYWADKCARHWSTLGAAELSEQLLPIFVEFNRMCEAEKAARRESDV